MITNYPWQQLRRGVSGWLLKWWGGSPALPGGRSAAGELAGRSPGCGCWDQLPGSAAAAGFLPGGGYHGDQLPCVKLCGREPIENNCSMTQRAYSQVFVQYGRCLYIHIVTRKHTSIFKIQFWVSRPCGTHFQVDKVFHVLQGNPEQISHQINIPLLDSQVQHGLVTFDFLELEDWKWWKEQNETTRQNHKSDWKV